MFVYIVYIFGWFEGCGSEVSNPCFESYSEALLFADGLFGVRFDIRREFES